MSVLEIVSGVLLVLCSVAIILMVLFQEPKGNGLSGVIGGGEMMDNGSRTTHGVLVRYTKYAAIAFFVIALAVCVISARFS